MRIVWLHLNKHPSDVINEIQLYSERVTALVILSSVLEYGFLGKVGFGRTGVASL